METKKIDNDQDSSYGKYFIELKTNCTSRYVVWGQDLTEDGQDKILVDVYSRVLLFQDIQQAISYILTTQDVLFDSENLKKWAVAYFQYSTNSITSYDMDHIENIIGTDVFLDIISISRKECLFVLDFVNLISDYAYQINDKYLITMYKGEHIKIFLDFIYNNYFWTIPKEEIQSSQNINSWKEEYPLFKSVMLSLLSSFKSRFLICL